MCTISSITGESIIVDSDPGSNPPTFNFERSDSLDGLGETQTVTCKAISKTDYPNLDENGDPATDDNGDPIDTPKESPDGTTELTPKNPCLDTDFVTIDALSPNLDDVSYNVGDGPLVITPAHSDFTVTTSPITHDLCGDLVVTPQYEGAPVAPGDPVTYDDPNN